MTRRTLVTSLAIAATAEAQTRRRRVEWKPKLGVLGPFTPANVEFARAQGYNNMIINIGRRSPLEPETVTDAQIADAKAVLAKANIERVRPPGHPKPHLTRSGAARPRECVFRESHRPGWQTRGAVYRNGIGEGPGQALSAAGGRHCTRLQREVFFGLREEQGPPALGTVARRADIATSPVGYEALFKRFGDSPYVGLQYDPSHLTRQFMDPMQTARDFVDKIYDVHLKDTEILWPVLRAGGINPVNRASWWRYRIPGLGSINWAEFFSILQDAGYQGAMSVEHEDPLYGGDNNPGPDFSEEFKVGFVMAKRYLSQYVP